MSGNLVVVAQGRDEVLERADVTQLAGVDEARDVLLRIDTHPASRIDELLPDRWKPPPDAKADSAAA